MRNNLDLAGYWDGRLTLTEDVDVDAPAVIEQPFYVPLPWNKQIEHLRWPAPLEESERAGVLSGVVRPVQNQNFRDVMRKFNEGVITYRRTVHLSPSQAVRDGMRAYLVFEGSNYVTKARVNGTAVGDHEGGHLAFEFDITDALRTGDNAFEIAVDNTRRKFAVPQEQFNWQNYGGIYRPLRIEWRADLHIAHVAVAPGRDDEGWFVDIRVTLNDSSDAPLRITASSGDDVQVVDVSTDSSDHAAARLRFDHPLVWQPGEGGMSELVVELLGKEVTGNAIDRVERAFGLRTVEIVGRSILVNGEPVRLLGAAMHEQHPSFGNSLPPWQAAYDIQLMQICGFNALRTAHYPHAQSLYDAADRAGMLVVAELPCWQFQVDHFEHAPMRDFACDYARQMVAQLGGHPSVIGWIVQNESKTFEPSSRGFFQAIHDAFKDADPSRPTISADSPEPPEHLAVVKRVAEEPHKGLPETASIVDMCGMNHYAGWYSDKSDMLPRQLDAVVRQVADKPVIVTEFGAEGIAGERSLMMDPWTEDYQSQLVCRHIQSILAREDVAGFFVWLFVDYECASIGIRAINAKGLVDPHRRPKLIYDQVRHLLRQVVRQPAARMELERKPR